MHSTEEGGQDWDKRCVCGGGGDRLVSGGKFKENSSEKKESMKVVTYLLS